MHRDVKPGNLMVNTDGVVKLADFGIAKAAEQSDITKVGSVLGTAAYLSPEQARGEPAGPASDIYALGVVSYQLMAGRLPYEAASLTDLARLQESGPPPRLQDAARDVSPALAAAVGRALARDPERRYVDAAEMEDALRDGLAGVAPNTEDLEATRALPDDEATRMLSPTASTGAVRPRRPLQPVDEPPRRTGDGPSRPRAPAAAAAGRRSAAARASGSRSCSCSPSSPAASSPTRRSPAPPRSRSSSTRTSAATSTRPSSPSRTSSSRTPADQLTTPYGS